IAGLTTILASRASYKQGVSLLHTLAAQAQHAAQQGTGAAHHAASAATAGLPPQVAALFAGAFDDTFKLVTGVAIAGAVLGLLLSRRLAEQAAQEAVGVPAHRSEASAAMF